MKTLTLSENILNSLINKEMTNKEAYTLLEENHASFCCDEVAFSCEGSIRVGLLIDNYTEEQPAILNALLETIKKGLKSDGLTEDDDEFELNLNLIDRYALELDKNGELMLVGAFEGNNIIMSDALKMTYDELYEYASLGNEELD